MEGMNVEIPVTKLPLCEKTARNLAFPCVGTVACVLQLTCFVTDSQSRFALTGQMTPTPGQIAPYVPGTTPFNAQDSQVTVRKSATEGTSVQIIGTRCSPHATPLVSSALKNMASTLVRMDPDASHRISFVTT